MRLKLWHQFALALAFTSGLSLLVALLFSQQSFKQGFLAYLNAQEQARVAFLINRLRRDYQKNHDWSFVEGPPALWHRYLRQTFNEAGRQGLFPELINGQQNGVHQPPFTPPPARHKNRQAPIPRHSAFTEPFSPSLRPPPPHQERSKPLIKVALTDTDQQIIAGEVDERDQNTYFPISFEQQVIAQLAVKTVDQFSSQGEQEFVKQQQRAFIRIAALALLATSLLAWLFGRVFYARIKPLSSMANQLTRGDFSPRISSQRKDEIGQLANDLDQLAATLEQNRSSRQRWIADISHELRTPLSVLYGELEALQDGVRPLQPVAVNSLHTEVTRLNQLVDDLYQLSMADIGAISYKFELTDVVAVLEQEVDQFQAQFNEAGIDVQIKANVPQSTYIEADSVRLTQLFKNLAQNTLRYTDAPGRLIVELSTIQKKQQKRLQLRWLDSAPGVPQAAHSHIFERLTRVESSRNRAVGGAGLGLAIVKEIAKAHRAKIQATSSEFGGVCIEISFPIKATS